MPINATRGRAVPIAGTSTSTFHRKARNAPADKPSNAMIDHDERLPLPISPSAFELLLLYLFERMFVVEIRIGELWVNDLGHERRASDPRRARGGGIPIRIRRELLDAAGYRAVASASQGSCRIPVAIGSAGRASRIRPRTCSTLYRSMTDGARDFGRITAAGSRLNLWARKQADRRAQIRLQPEHVEHRRVRLIAQLRVPPDPDNELLICPDGRTQHTPDDDRDVLLAVHRIGHGRHIDAGADVEPPHLVERLVVEAPRSCRRAGR